jgi:membrane-associated phospholipid phosphatase
MTCRSWIRARHQDDRCRDRRSGPRNEFAADRHVAGMASHPSRAWLHDAKQVDQAVYAAIADTPTPTLDRGMQTLSNAANYSRLWLAVAGGLALIGGRSGRRAAAQGLVSIAVTSALVNILAKRVGRRQRPERPLRQAAARRVRMPTSLSFPSGHSAAAFAFATAVGSGWPVVAVPLHAAAGTVAYSRVHTGVHYPGDVVVGSILGTVIAQLTTHALDHRRSESGLESGGS